MDEDKFAAIARDCGLDAEDYMSSQFHGYESQPATGYGNQHATGDMSALYDEAVFGDYSDDFEYSSPCPTQYHNVTAGNSRQSAIPMAIDQYRQNLAPHQRQEQDYNFNTSYRPSREAVPGPFDFSASGHRAPSYDIQQPQDMRGENTYNTAALKEHNPNAMNGNQRGNDPRNLHGIRLRPVSDLTDAYRGMFKFGVFNAVQSSCFDTLMYSDEHMVISAPTGSGKTVLFELAIIRMLNQAGATGRQSKCIYVAPTKSLCSEKYRDWTMKFQPLGINCCELTGDTVQFGKSAWGPAKDASVIVTTGEKWDSLTRNWQEHKKILSQIQLFLVDEVHILNEPRGSTLEVVVSRMRTRGSDVRFVVVSATVPNVDDVARWIGGGNPSRAAKIMQFGEEFRPCKLSRFVYGFPRHREQNDFSFARSLDNHLYSTLKQHAANKPILVFCSTRRGVIDTAERLMKDYKAATDNKQTLPWPLPTRIEHVFNDKRLNELASCSIGAHHAGLSMSDRRAIEDLYIKKTLRVIVATSTLAVGVNLPAHTVVIKGVKTFQNNKSQEYTDLDVVQMTGRAGRPQFDKEGVAIIMCESELEGKYNALVQGCTVLESHLHHNLSEHLNSEVGLGTITSIDSAKSWLYRSFLFQRIQKNPQHYAINKDSNQTWEDRINDMVMESISKLKQTELVEDGPNNTLSSTEYGDIMSKFYIRQSTMNMILHLPDRASLRETLETISAADEFSDIKIRAGEKQIYNKLRVHEDIRYQIKKVDKPSDKVFLIIQAVVAGINLADAEYKNGDNQPTMEVYAIFRHIVRIAKATLEVGIVKNSGTLIKNALDLVRILSAKAWEDRPIVLRQVEQIGEKSIKVLAENGISSLADLRKQDSLRIEVLLNRRPPFGESVLASVKQFPQYTIQIVEVDVTVRATKHVEIDLSIECGLIDNKLVEIKSKRNKSRADMTAVLTMTNDNDFIDYRRIPTKSLAGSKSFTVTAKLTKPSQSVVVYMSSETIAGTTCTSIYKPHVNVKDYPTMDTRPQSAVDITIAGLEEDPHFWDPWNMDEDEDDIPVRDLTHTEKKPVTPVVKGAQASSSTKTSILKSDKALSTKETCRIKQLPNGRYECNHTCKDKTHCRHLCCRDGVVKPPTWTKKRIEAMSAAEEQKRHSSSPVRADQTTSKPKSLSKVKPKVKPCDKPDSRIKQLEVLHDSTDVAQSLKLPEGRRIKLQVETVSRKPKPVPKFDIDFIDLKDDKPVGSRAELQLQDSDDDLPDARDLLNAYDHKEKDDVSSETNYSNSEFDALVRNVPLNEIIYLDDDEPSAPPSPPALSYFHTSPISQLPTTLASRKRSRDAQEESIIKRPKLQHQTQDRGPLFVPDLSDQGHEEEHTHVYANLSRPVPGTSLPASGAVYQQDEDFVLDESLFDILPATPSLVSTMSTYGERSYDSSYSIPSTVYKARAEDQPAKAATSDVGSLSTVQSPARKNADALPKGNNPPEAVDTYEDGLAELEAWLQSDAVEIVYN